MNLNELRPGQSARIDNVGGQGALLSRIIYTLVGAAGLWCITLLFRDRVAVRD